MLVVTTTANQRLKRGGGGFDVHGSCSGGIGLGNNISITRSLFERKLKVGWLYKLTRVQFNLKGCSNQDAALIWVLGVTYVVLLLRFFIRWAKSLVVKVFLNNLWVSILVYSSDSALIFVLVCTVLYRWCY